LILPWRLFESKEETSSNKFQDLSLSLSLSLWWEETLLAFLLLDLKITQEFPSPWL
jgi:hypothetical protein